MKQYIFRCIIHIQSYVVMYVYCIHMYVYMCEVVPFLGQVHTHVGQPAILDTAMMMNDCIFLFKMISLDPPHNLKPQFFQCAISKGQTTFPHLDEILWKLSGKKNNQ